MTRDQLYHYIKTYCISKVKVGRIIKISKQELDNLLLHPRYDAVDLWWTMGGNATKPGV